MLRTLLIDDDQLSIQSLRSTLAHYCPDIEIVGECCNAMDGPEMINTLNPDLCFLDILMPGKNGIDLLKEVKECRLQVIFVTGHERYAIEALRLAAADYLMKPINPVLLVTAIDKVKNRLTRRSM